MTNKAKDVKKYPKLNSNESPGSQQIFWVVAAFLAPLVYLAVGCGLLKHFPGVINGWWAPVVGSILALAPSFIAGKKWSDQYSPYSDKNEWKDIRDAEMQYWIDEMRKCGRQFPAKHPEVFK